MKKIATIILSIAILLTSIPMGALSVNATTTYFAGGSGTKTDPYLIETKEHLNNVRKDLDAHYKMTADIVFTETDFTEGGNFYNDGKGWRPIGEYGVSVFNGVFDGNNHSVKGLYINIAEENTVAVGLFGLCKNAKIINLSVSEGNIIVSAENIYAGGIVGFLESSVIENCCNLCDVKMSGNLYYARGGGVAGYVTGSSNVTDCKNNGAITTIDIIGSSQSGGIIGYITGSSSVSSCYNSGYVESNYYAGGIVGEALRATINDSYNTGNVVASTTEYYSCAGGISGCAIPAQINRCYNTGEISSSAKLPYCGGISGTINDGDISQCYNLGEIKVSFTSYSRAGGITGYTCHKSKIDNSFNAGHISVLSYSSMFSQVGGITGEMVNGCSVANCYNVGVIETGYSKVYAGGIVGSNETSTIGKCYFLNNIEQGTAVGSGETISATHDEMSKIAMFQGFDFDTTWEFVEGNLYEYPTLKNNSHYIISSDEYQGGEGTKTFPFLIASPKQLHNVRNYLGAYYKLVRDIVFTDADFAEGGMFYFKGAGWLPIKSTTSPYKYFTGVFDGNGFTIHNLTINADGDLSSSVGLFAENKGTILNLGLENCNISVLNDGDVYTYVGSIAGRNSGTISNCYTTGRIVATGKLGSSFAGGIVGWHDAGNIKECYNMAVVNATYAAGGIVGENYASIKNCFNSGLITAQKNEDTSSYYTLAGGIAGSGNGFINCCYNIGYIVSSTNAAGISVLGSTETNCYYYNGITEGNSSYSSGNCTLEHMKREECLGGFDFQEIWTMKGDTEYPYPELLNTPMNFTKKILGTTLSSFPYKTEYYVGLETLDVEGGKIATIYNDGTKQEVNLENSMVSGFDNSKVGQQSLIVKHNNESISFDVEVLPLIYNNKITTDETITLEFSAKKEFEFVLSDETVAKITKVQSSSVQWGSSIQVSSSATIVPLKPGFVVIRAVDNAGNILSKSLLLIEEGEHQFVLLGTLKEVTCTEPGIELHECKFCKHQEEITIDTKGHKYDNACDTTCNVCGETRDVEPHKYDNACDKICNICSEIREITHDYADATCTTPKTCKVCGFTSGSKLGHTYTNACDASCNRCNDTRTINHTYDNSCDANCNICKQARNVSHSYSPATCTNPKTCIICGKTSGKQIEHNYWIGYYIDNDSHWHQCETCGHKKDLASHVFSNTCDNSCNVCDAGRTIKHSYTTTTKTTKATASKNGRIYKTCNICGETSNLETIYRVKTIKLSATSYTYNGKAKKPTVSVKDSKGKKISSKYFTVKYAGGRKKIGKYAVTITFKGKYSGTKKLYFTIGPKNPKTVKVTLENYNNATLSWSKVSGASGYKVYWKTSPDEPYSYCGSTKSPSMSFAMYDGTKNTFKVIAYKKVKGVSCNNAGKTCSIYSLKKVSGVKVNKSGTKVKVSWKNISGETGYEISQSTKKSGTNIIDSYKTTSGNNKLLSAPKGKTYYYKVRAYKIENGQKIYAPWSNPVKYAKK